MPVVDLEVTLVDLPYEVKRRLTVPVAIKLTDLHMVMQVAMGWDNSHLYDFVCGKGRKAHRWSDYDELVDEYEHKMKSDTLADVLAAMGKLKFFTYTYDMGDSWEHDLCPGKPREAAAGEAVIAMHSADGACPPDDSGGAPGFSYMLDCVDDPSSDDHEEYLEWLGGPFDRVANELALKVGVARLAKRWAKRYPVAG